MSKLAPDILSHREIEQLIAAAGTSSTGLRNKAFLVLAWRAGLRADECRRLKTTSIDFTTGEVRVIGKGRKPRVTAVGGMGLAHLVLWRERRQKLGLQSPYFLCTLTSRMIGGSYGRAMVTRLAAKAGIERRAHLHGLRHRFCVDLIAEGADLTVVRDLLGHSSLQVTDVYTRRIGGGKAVQFAVGRA